MDVSTSYSHWSSLQMELLRIYDGKVRHGGRKKKISGPSFCYRAWLVYEGSGEIRIHNYRHTLRRGYWFIPPQRITWQDFSEDAKLLSVHFRAQWHEGTWLFDTDKGIEAEARRFPELETAARSMQKIAEENLPGADWSLSATFPSLEIYLQLDKALRDWILALSHLLKFLKIPTNSALILDERVKRGLQRLHQMPLHQKFREKQLASELNTSVAHLNRLFAQSLRRSPSEIFEQRRLDQALHRLTYTFTPIKQLSYDLGFCSPSHFSAWFRKRTGKNPRQLR